MVIKEEKKKESNVFVIVYIDEYFVKDRLIVWTCWRELKSFEINTR